MLSEFVHGRAFVCIDAANVESAAKDLEWHLDYRKLTALFDGQSLVNIRHYCVRHGVQNQDAFFMQGKVAMYVVQWL